MFGFQEFYAIERFTVGGKLDFYDKFPHLDRSAEYFPLVWIWIGETIIRFLTNLRFALDTFF